MIDRSKYITAQNEQHLQFWRSKYSETEGKFVLSDTQYNLTKADGKQLVVHTLTPETSALVKQLVKGNDDGIFVVLLTALQITLSRFTLSNKVVVDAPLKKAENPDVISLFFAADTAPEKTIKQLLVENQGYFTKAIQYQQVPVGVVEERLLNDTLSNVELSYEALHKQEDNSYHHLQLQVKVVNDSFNIEAKYETDMYSAYYVQTLLAKWETVLEHFKKPDTAIAAISLTTTAEVEKITNSDLVNAKYPETTIHELIEKRVTSSPENIALQFENISYTYEELNERANRMAHSLRKEHKIAANDLVAILLDRTDNMVLSILAVLKAGAVYVPVDPEYPAERIEFMLTDSGSKLLISTQHVLENTAIKHQLPVFDIEKTDISNYSAENPDNVNKPNDGAYVIYTSGSTGKPKGVLVSHRNVVRLMVNDKFQFDFNEKDVWTVFHSFCFDFSVWEMYGALVYGGKCVVVNKDTAKDTKKFLELVAKEKVTVLNQTPNAFYNFIFTAGEREDIKLKVRYVIFGGEALMPSKLSAWRKAYPKCKLVNMYGITETTVHVTYKEIGDKEIEKGISNIGKPIPTLACYIVDQNKQMQPVGVVGELMVAGAGLAKGYLNRADLTAEKFIDNPYKKGEKLYRSGDLARYLENGEMEYLGRIDFQVKIRGFRIELGEIENALLKHTSVKDVVVLDKKIGEDKHLVAYVVAKDGKTVSEEELKAELSKHVPAYMVPGYFVFMSKIPLTGNGKTDRKALPDPQENIDKVQVVEPVTETQIKIVAICKELLGHDKIGIKHDFFRVGGHSLKATMLIAKIRKEFGIELNLADIFQYPVLEELSEYIDKNDFNTYEGLKKAPEQESYKLSSSQKRMYILNQFNNIGLTYNMPSLVKLTGDVKEENIKQAVAQLVERHESLRTTFAFENNEPVQKIHKSVKLNYEYVELPDKDAENELRRRVTPFDITTGPLYKVVFAKTTSGEYYLLFDMHHIISDGISMAIMIADFKSLYKGDKLEPVAIQYKDFAWWQNTEEGQQRLQNLEKYWLDRFAGIVPVLEIPTDFPRPHIKKMDGDLYQFGIDSKITNKLKKLSDSANVTMYMTLLASFKSLLSTYAQIEDVVVGTPVSGRPISDLQHCIGFFVNTIAVRSTVRKEDTFSSYLSQLKQLVTSDFKYQDYSFEALVEKLNLQRDMSRNPLFDYVFSYTNKTDKLEELEGLSVEYRPVNTHTTKFDLSLAAQEFTDSINVTIEYSSVLYTKETIERFAQHFTQILQQVGDNADIQISEIELLTAAETKKLKEFNATKATFDNQKTAIQLLSDIVKKYPESVAMVFKGEEVSYKKLEETTDVLAAYLIEKGVKKGDVVAISAIPSFEMMYAIWAVLKAGAAFLPIDPALPEERAKYMLDDSTAKVLLSYGLSAEWKSDQIKLEGFDYSPKASSTMPQVKATDLAYLIYTSGSTGKPKGVKITHKGLSNVTQWNIEYFGIKNKLTAIKYSGFSFDASVIEIFPNLCSGATLHIIPNEIRLNVTELANYFNEHKIESCFLPTKITEQLMDAELPHLQFMITGGEKLNKYKKANYRLYNTYGPTENSVDSTCFEVDKEYANIPIGKPIGNVRAYIVNTTNNTKLVPIGIPGELCITGDSISPGYWNRDELTATQFVDCPFEKGEKMYRTGDLCRWLPDGNIEYLGRIDKQVKIRGYRIETGEVEFHISSFAGINEVVVLANNRLGGEAVLCAYISPVDIDVAALKLHLRQFLPDYMVPAYFVPVERIPMTANGKADAGKLLEIKISSSYAGSAAYVAPETELQKDLVDIWKEVLQIEQVGIRDNFFEIGGNSLKIVQLFKMLEGKFTGKVDIGGLFDNPTIEQLALKISESETTEETSTEDINVIDF